MKIYNTVDDYRKKAKINDIVIFGGRGIVDGICVLESKYDTYRVFKTEPDFVFKNYGSRVPLRVGTGYNNQQIAVLTKQEFNKLDI